MATTIQVGIIGATGNTGRSIVAGLLSSTTNYVVTSFTRKSSLENDANRNLEAQGLRILGYDLNEGRGQLVNQLKDIDVLISCMTWEFLEDQIPWIEATKQANVKRFVPSEWVGPAPQGIIDIKDKKLKVLGAIHRSNLPYTIIDVGCWYQVFVPKVPSGRTDHKHSVYIDHRIVEDGDQKFALTDMDDIGKYVAQIIFDPRTLNKQVFAYTEVLSMNELWSTMAAVTGEEPPTEYISRSEIEKIIEESRQKLQGSPERVMHPSNIMHVANFNMGQYRISWCIRGDNTPEYAEYLGYLDFWKLYPTFTRGKSLESFYQSVLDGSL